MNSPNGAYGARESRHERPGRSRGVREKPILAAGRCHALAGDHDHTQHEQTEPTGGQRAG